MGFAGGLDCAEPELRGGQRDAQWVSPGGLSLAWGCLHKELSAGMDEGSCERASVFFSWGMIVVNMPQNFKKTLREKLDSHPGITQKPCGPGSEENIWISVSGTDLHSLFPKTSCSPSAFVLFRLWKVEHVGVPCEFPLHNLYT